MIHLKVVACFISCKSVLKEINHQHQQHQPGACQRESGITSARGETQRGDGTQVRVSFYILWSNKILQLEFRIQTVEPAASSQHAATDKDNLISIANQSRPHLLVKWTFLFERPVPSQECHYKL